MYIIYIEYPNPVVIITYNHITWFILKSSLEYTTKIRHEYQHRGSVYTFMRYRSYKYYYE